MTATRTPPPGATAFLPVGHSLAALRAAARSCHGCPLHHGATQTVFGEGRVTASIVMVGEIPGNDEDLAGHPFVGPAGRVLDTALAAAGLDRAELYLTNIVKHFKFEPRGERRIHKKPSVAEVTACMPWFEAELDVIRPRVLVLLGATAAQALMGRAFRVTIERGKLLISRLAEHVLATVHPASILRQPNSDDRRREMAHFIDDLRVVAGVR